MMVYSYKTMWYHLLIAQYYFGERAGMLFIYRSSIKIVDIFQFSPGQNANPVLRTFLYSNFILISGQHSAFKH